MDDKVLASVGGKTITERDVDMLVMQMGQRGQSYNNPQGRAMLLDQLINQRLFLMDAMRNMYEREPAFKEQMAGQKICYELATPTPITTTAIQIKTMGGTESIYSDAGDVSGEYYTTTAGTIKDLVTITEDITSQVTKNTTDFSDILLKVSQNNKVVSVEIYSATTSAAVNETFLSNLPKPAMNCKVLLANTTLGEDGTILGTLKTSGELEITTPGAKTFSGLITYVAK